MKTFLIERNVPGAGKLTASDLKNIAIASCNVLDEMGPSIEWINSYVSDDKLHCVYRAENEELIRIHGKKGNFPVTTVREVVNTFSPATAN